MLRNYQQRTIDQLYEWLANNTGNPCLVLPTGAGKSHVIAALCKDAIQNWPDTMILMLTSQKELIEQNAEKMRQHWPNAPMGIYSAGMNRRQLGEPITFAGIQSVRNKSKEIGFIDLIIVDECHLISHKGEGSYRTFINQLKEINPNIRVVGLTATPYRLGHGLITDKPAIFDALIEPVVIQELIRDGYLAPLKSKITKTKIDTSGVHKRGGEYIESELQAAVDNSDTNSSIIDEVIHLAGDRKSWLFFCTGINHAQNVAEELRFKGIHAACVTGETPKKEREKILSAFKAGKIKALTNANVLTTGFDAPNIDLIAMLRPTMSPGLYCQMAGRGLRLKKHTDHCLVLDFAGVVEAHGPITHIITPDKVGGEGKGEAPTKTCEECGEIVATAVKICPSCDAEFQIKPKPELFLRNHDIMGFREKTEMKVTDWRWRKHTSKTSGKEMLMVTYYGLLSDKPVISYLPVMHDGIAGSKARNEIFVIAQKANVNLSDAEDLDALVWALSNGSAPTKISFRQDGNFYRITEMDWSS